MRMILVAEISTDLDIPDEITRLNFEMTLISAMTRFSKDGVAIVKAVKRLETEELTKSGYSVTMKEEDGDGETIERLILSRDG